uniref:Uncharacterized protein n=1 Tax=Anguilla anguilla TaxID=7936 RepID=A0A0E9VTM1_ANGAN
MKSAPIYQCILPVFVPVVTTAHCIFFLLHAAVVALVISVVSHEIINLIN